jgi:hypothetical protein
VKNDYSENYNFVSAMQIVIADALDIRKMCIIQHIFFMPNASAITICIADTKL